MDFFPIQDSRIGSAYFTEDLILGKFRTVHSLLIANVHNSFLLHRRFPAYAAVVVGFWCLMSSCIHSNVISTTDFLTVTIVGFHRLIAATFRRDSTVLTWDWLYSIPWTVGRASCFLWRSLFSLRSRVRVANDSSRWGIWGLFLAASAWAYRWGSIRVWKGLQWYFPRLIVNSPLSKGF